MLHVQLDEARGIAVLEPDGALSPEDFEAAAKIIDPFIESKGSLNGLVVHVQKFPGWESFAALTTHLKFVRQHHRKIARVAFASESPLKVVVERMASHFVSAEIKVFPFEELDAAVQWIVEGSS